jgi:hypothetical protein
MIAGAASARPLNVSARCHGSFLQLGLSLLREDQRCRHGRVPELQLSRSGPDFSAHHERTWRVSLVCPFGRRGFHRARLLSLQRCLVCRRGNNSALADSARRAWDDEAKEMTSDLRSSVRTALSSMKVGDCRLISIK